MDDKLESFLINVTIIEGRHFPTANKAYAVYVRVGNKKKCTPICYNADAPFFNEFFVFEFLTTLEEFLDKTITLTVFRPRRLCIPRKTIGYISLDVATVWSADDHQFYHKWAAIVPSVKDTETSTRGYLKLDIGIVRKGEAFKIPTIDAEATDDIEGNLLQSDGYTTERQKANYVFKIFYGVSLCRRKYLDSKYINPLEGDPPNAFVEVCFAGQKGRTSTKYNRTNPVWNESIVIPEYYPAFCQRIKINVWNTDKCGSSLIASRTIDLNLISSPGDYGFLPNFGPTYLHFYGKCNKNESYIGKILMSFYTELPHNMTEIAKFVTVSQTSGIREKTLWKTELVLLSGIIFQCNLIRKRYRSKPIWFEINFGHSQPFIGTSSKLPNQTYPANPKSQDKIYWNIPFGYELPCLYSKSTWPDLRHRMFLQNRFLKVIDELKSRLEALELLFTKQSLKKSQRDLEFWFKDAFFFVSASCNDLISECSLDQIMFVTELDKRKHLMRTTTLNKLVQNASQVTTFDKTCFKTLYKMVYQLEHLAYEEECWPDVFITVIVNNKKVAYAKFSPNALVYSPNAKEMGKLCGVRQNILLQAFKQKKLATAQVMCRLDMILWIGLDNQKNNFFNLVPSPYTLSTHFSDGDYPSFIKTLERYNFQARVHVYQGKFSYGSDKTGLCDPFVRVVIGDYCRQTEVSQATLNPLWDQTLVFPKLSIGGSKDYIKSNPPTVIAEVFDQDPCNKVQFLGRCMFIPKVKCSDTPYKSPDFPPKLVWHKVTSNNNKISGEIMVSAEILELTTDEVVVKKKWQHEIIRVPSDVKPSRIKYRIEVAFWGVRDLHKINMMPIIRPKAILECVYASINSDVIHVLRGSLNFRDNLKHIDVSLPADTDYIPPLCLKLYDCRAFGKYVLVGIQLFDMVPFLYEPETVKERNQKLFGEYYRDHYQDTTYSVSAISLDTLSESKDNQPATEISTKATLTSKMPSETVVAFTQINRNDLKKSRSAFRHDFQTYYIQQKSIKNHNWSNSSPRFTGVNNRSDSKKSRYKFNETQVYNFEIKKDAETSGKQNSSQTDYRKKTFLEFPTPTERQASLQTDKLVDKEQGTSVEQPTASDKETSLQPGELVDSEQKQKTTSGIETHLQPNELKNNRQRTSEDISSLKTDKFTKTRQKTLMHLPRKSNKQTNFPSEESQHRTSKTVIKRQKPKRKTSFKEESTADLPALRRKTKSNLEKIADQDSKKTSWTILLRRCFCPDKTTAALDEESLEQDVQKLTPSNELEPKQDINLTPSAPKKLFFFQKMFGSRSGEYDPEKNLPLETDEIKNKSQLKCIFLPCKVLLKITKTIIKIIYLVLSTFIFIISWFLGCIFCRKRKKKVSCKSKEGFFERMTKKVSKRFQNEKEEKVPYFFIDKTEDMEVDWWTKYYDSFERKKIEGESGRIKKVETLMIYSSELENQPEFQMFQDTLQTFQMCKENRTGDDLVDEQHIKATVKAAIQIYRLPSPSVEDYVTPTGCPLKKGIFQDFYSNEATHFLVRVYCVRGINLQPRDINGKSDSYLRVVMGNHVIKDQENYVPKHLNPMYGRCFEMKGVFPHNHTITIQVWDYDIITGDDLIGETKIDIENRFYTKFLAQRGLAEHYYKTGYCAWRDYEKPTKILAKLCKSYNLRPPQYTDNHVKIGTIVFAPFGVQSKLVLGKQDLALYALRNWKKFPSIGFELVPEHIETRSLYHHAKPGIEQGKLQMWVDIFPFLDTKYPEQVNITPRKPTSYELRVIIWNTEDVILQDDDFFVGEKMSDIYVKGWMISSLEAQCTDIHYRSMTGEGNFNWRFIFRFLYLSIENLIVIHKKDSMFSKDESEYKIPCKLTLQIWDKDAISADDFLGSLSLDLASLPRGAPHAKTCSLENLSPSAPTINLFRKKHTKGWWPARAVDDHEKTESLAGKIQIELEILTEDEATKDPVGFGRSDPHALTQPIRPLTSFAWMSSPLKTLYAIIFQQNKWRCCRCCCYIYIVYFIISAVGVVPKVGLEKILGGKS